MKISALRLFNVKRFANRGVAIENIGDGVNVLCAVNEHGKSTSFEAMHALFFQPHSSTAGDVRSLRPYSGGNPLVEADIATEGGRFRITKQFYGGRSARVVDLATGRLVAQADEAENFIAELIRGGTAGPAGLLWVRQGITGIEKRSRSEEDSEKQVRESLLSSVQGEVEAVTGGRRMAEIMAAATAALGELVTTTGRPKAGGRYAAALDARDRLATDEHRLKAEVDALRAALDARTAAAKRLAEIERAEDRQERRQAIERAQAAFDAARAQGETLKTAQAELQLVLARRDAADRDLKAFRAALAKAAALTETRRAAELDSAQAIDRRRAAAEAVEAARTEADAAEAQERDARDLLARLDAALKARDAAERQAGLVQRLADAEAARQQVERTEAEHARLAIPAKAIDVAQAVEIEIAKLRAVEDALRPTVAVRYEAVSVAAITLDGAPLADGEERGYDGQAHLAVPGIGTITLRSNRPAQSDDRLRKAEEKHRALLASMAVDSLRAARARQVEAQQKEAELRDLRSRLAALAPDGLAKLRAEVAAAGLGAAETLELKADPVEVRTALAGAEARRMAANQALREVEPLRTGADEAYVVARTAIASVQAELAQVEAILGAAEERAGREAALTQTLADLDATLAAARSHAEALSASTVDLDSAAAALKRARSVEEAAEREIAGLRESIAGLNAEIRARSDEAVEESWRETAEAHAAAAARAASFAQEVAVLQRLAGALETARAEARELYLKPVMTELRPLLGLLFDDVSITFDEKTLLPHSILRNGQEEDVERLSGGMREQLSVLTRLAFARLLARDGRPAPVILDDALVYSDDDRIERMFDALHRQSRDQQIIVFSCRQRAFAKLGGNVLQLTDWQPGG